MTLLYTLTKFYWNSLKTNYDVYKQKKVHMHTNTTNKHDLKMSKQE